VKRQNIVPPRASMGSSASVDGTSRGVESWSGIRDPGSDRWPQAGQPGRIARIGTGNPGTGDRIPDPGQRVL